MTPTNPRSATVTEEGAPNPWINRHQNVSQIYDKLYSVLNPPPPNSFNDLQLTVAALQGIVADAIRDGKTLRALGGGWSLSSAAVTDGRLIDTLGLNSYFPAVAASVVPAYTGSPAQLMYLQCGINIKEANDLLFGLPTQLALKTSGASNGQTIAGAASTGTHGSRFGFGAMQDYVVGMHLITGPATAIWLERASYPVLSDLIVNGLGAQLVRDDTLFNSALVSFGSFGIIHGMMIEADPLYLLEVNRVRMALGDPLRTAMQTLDFSGIATPHPGEAPFHFEVVVNPHDIGKGAYVTTMYRRAYTANYVKPPLSPSGLGPGDDVLSIMGDITNRLPGLVGSLVNLIVPAEYPLMNNVLGTPGEIFNSNFTFQKEMSAEIGVALEDTVRALDVMTSLPEVNDYPGLLAFRWVKGSSALLAFTKFATSCAIELPSAFSNRTTNYYTALWAALDAAGIPYTLHWGQMNNFTPARVRTMYGDAAVDQWIASRNQLLDAPSRAVFTSPFLQQCGLG
jgi:hypothetical protein